MGKFTMSVKKFVQEVETERSKEESIQTNERLKCVTQKISESYNTAKTSLTTLHGAYETSKDERNIFTRYVLLKAIIKNVIRLDSQYWILVQIPKQEKQEQVTTYVLRACCALEKSSETRAGEGVKTQAKKNTEEAAKKERRVKLEAMSVREIEEDNTQLINDLYRLLKKYAALRTLMGGLKSEYVNSKNYPAIPRYTMLKDMIKDVLRDPTYMEVCHENSL
ncbi:Uncharacterised protein g10749 [Pycnogonum litorale]